LALEVVKSMEGFTKEEAKRYLNDAIEILEEFLVKFFKAQYPWGLDFRSFYCIAYIVMSCEEKLKIVLDKIDEETR